MSYFCINNSVTINIKKQLFGNYFKKGVLYQRQKTARIVHFLYANNSPAPLKMKYNEVVVQLFFFLFYRIRHGLWIFERRNGGTKNQLKQWKSKKIEIHHTEDKHGNWYHTAGVKTWYAVMHWTKPSKSPRLCMEAGEVKCNGLPIILYFPARATIFRHNTFFVCAHQDMAFILYVMI